MILVCRYLLPCVAVLLIQAEMRSAESSADQPAGQANWPQKVVVNVGDVRTRIDGPKMWTLSGIEYRDAVMATEDSAYGSVLTIRNVGHLGTAHFLDVPGKPGAVEKENVTSLQLFADDKPISKQMPMMNLNGQSFRMERKSNIRAMNLETSISLRDGVLIETVNVLATGPIDLRVAYPWMYAWTKNATAFVFGDGKGIQRRGQFRNEGPTVSEVIKSSTWMAVFNPASGQGSVCRFLKHPPKADGWFLLIDAPGVYRKVAAYTLEDKVVEAGFKGTYQSAVGFFTATESDWEQHALRRATELKTSAIHP